MKRYRLTFQERFFLTLLTVILQIKATRVYRCTKFINRLREKTKSGLQTKTEGNTSNIRGELRHNKNTTLKCNTHRNEL